MSLSTDYKGYTIRYSENEEVWTCYDVGASNEKLGRVKAKIDDMHRKLRKANAFHCLDVSGYRGATAQDATIVEYLGPIRKKRSSERVGTGEIEDHQVAYMSVGGGLSDKKTRQTGALSKLTLDTTANRHTIAEAARLMEQAREIETQAASLLKQLSSPKIEDIADLVAASDHRFDEMEQNGTKT